MGIAEFESFGFHFFSLSLRHLYVSGMLVLACLPAHVLMTAQITMERY